MTTATPATPAPTANTLFVRNGKSTIFRPLSGFATRLWLTSTTLLFVELLLIRWVPAEVRYIGFFSNFLLMASFLGIGLGILLALRLLSRVEQTLHAPQSLPAFFQAPTIADQAAQVVERRETPARVNRRS